jgi:hypothetical protein
MKLVIFFALLVVAVPGLAFADDTVTAPAEAAPPPRDHVPRMSHNVSATTNMMDRHECTVGIQILGCGVTEKWSLGTSPWLYINYNMANVLSRFTLKEYENKDRWSLQVSYFKTYKKHTTVGTNADGSQYTYNTGPFQMEALWLMWLRSFHLSPHYTVHMNFHDNYYWDDTYPFSIRRPIPGRSHFQFNLTSLHEIDLVNGWFVLGEIGFLDFTQPVLYIHSGSSIGYSGKSWSFHIGFTVDGSINSLFFGGDDRRDYQQHLRSDPLGYGRGISYTQATWDYAMHPEFELQYFF